MAPAALILGGARCLAEDEATARGIFEPAAIIACNHAARDHPGPLDHWATFHPELFPLWIAARRKAGHPPAGQLWHARHRQSPLASKPIEPLGGSSGLLCVKVALDLGFSRIVLAGVPMLKTECHYDSERHWIEARQYWPAWERAAPAFAGRVRSMSGWTLKLLGRPSAEWLNDGC